MKLVLGMGSISPKYAVYNPSLQESFGVQRLLYSPLPGSVQQLGIADAKLSPGS